MAEPALQLDGVSAGYGETVVLEDIRLALAAGETLSIIGRNGVGKTTLLATVMGHNTLHGGDVRLHGKTIARLPAHRRNWAGLGYVPQEREVFPSLTLRENLEVAARPGAWTIDKVFGLFPRLAERLGAAPSMLRPAGRRRDVVEESMHLLDTLKLADDAGHRVSELPYGRQRLVEIAIALAQHPRVLLLDEPAAGVPSSESHLILDVIGGLDPDIAILIIEHDMDVVFRFASRITVLVAGAVLTEGTPQEIRADARVRAVYLGEEFPHG